jgi:aldose 1-epimerase
MRAFEATIIATASLTSFAAAQTGSATTSGSIPEYTLQAENITAKFIPYGARLTSLVVPDRDGNEQDVAWGYDDPQQYVNDTENSHTFLGKSHPCLARWTY